jgi:putative cell wall-binding protein
VLGPAPAGTTVHLQVDLRPRHTAILAADVAAVSSPSSPDFRHFDSVAAFRSTFGATEATIHTVATYLRHHGLQVGPVAANGLAMAIRGPASAVAAAFATPMVAVRTVDGATVVGSTAAVALPGAVAQAVDAVQGLDPWVTARHTAIDVPEAAATSPGQRGAPVVRTAGIGTAGPTNAGHAGTAPSGATNTASAEPSTAGATPATSTPGSCAGLTDTGADTPTELAGTYGLGSFWSDADLGQGMTVAVVEFDEFTASDITTFDQCLGISTSVTVDAAPGATFTGQDSAEPTGDIETMASLLPDAAIVDEADSDDAGFGPVLDQAVTASPLPSVVSISWGICDADMGQADEQADNVYLAEAAVQGQTVVASSGDSGAEGCGSSQPSVVSAEYPASSPYVLAVGGTTYAASTGAAVWNQTSGTVGTSGGGLNPYAAQPSWQTAPGTTAYQGSSWCTAPGGSCRAVPDVSAIATAIYPLYCTSTGCATSGWQLVGGTSMAAPSWAAALALAQQQCGSSGLGLVDPLLYALADVGDAPLGPVAAGTNAWFTAYAPAGVFTSTGTGYSPVTGLGALGEGGPSLAGGQLCRTPSAVPTDTLSTSSLTVGPAAPGATATGAFTITAGTAASLTVTGATVAGSAYGTGSPFTARLGSCGTTGTSGDTVAPGGTCTVDVTFSDQDTGTYHDLVAVDDDADGTLQEVAVSATVEPLGTLALSTTSLPFGQVQQDTNQYQLALRITDTSTTASVPSLAATLTTASSSLSDGPTLDDTCGPSLAAGASCTVAVVLDSDQAPGTYDGTLEVTAAAANLTSVSVPVSATVTSATLSDSVAPTAIDLGTVTVGTTTTTKLVVTDTSSTFELGLLALEATGTDASAVTLAADDCSGSVLAPNATCSVEVEVDPQSPGPLDAAVEVPRADGVVTTVPTSGDAVAATSTGTSSSGSGIGGGGGGATGGSSTGGSSTGGSSTGGSSSGGSSTSGGTAGSSGGATGGGGGGAGSGQAGGGSSTTPTGSPPSTTRVVGQTADGTAIAVAQSLYPRPDSASAVVLARDDQFSDALAGGPLAAAVGGPLLITPGADLSDQIDPTVLSEIEQVLAPGGTVYVLGGPLALAPSIDQQLQQAGYVPQRVYGQTEYGTAVAIAELLGDPTTVFEATALDFSDALSAVPAAIADHGAILLTDGAQPAPETVAYLQAHPPTVRYAIGGPLAAAGADPSAIAVYGETAYGTAAAVASRFFPSASVVGVATGTTFTDALAGGVAMAHLGGPMLIVPTSGVPASIAAYLAGDQSQLDTVTVFGGPLAVSSGQVSAVVAAVGS